MGRVVKEFAPFALKEGEKLHLRVFIDKSVIEIYANHRQAITRRVYPERDDSTGVFFSVKMATLSLRLSIPGR